MFSIGANVLLEEDISASQHSLAGGNSALNLGLASYASNPAHLIGPVASAYSLFYDMGFQDSQLIRVNFLEQFRLCNITTSMTFFLF